jgi:hypothetical protein
VDHFTGEHIRAVGVQLPGVLCSLHSPLMCREFRRSHGKWIEGFLLSPLPPNPQPVPLGGSKYERRIIGQRRGITEETRKLRSHQLVPQLLVSSHKEVMKRIFVLIPLRT